MIEHGANSSVLEGSPDSVIVAEGFNDEPRATPIELLTQFARYKRLIAQITGASILIGAVLCAVLPVRYTATAKLMPPQQTGSAAAFFMNQLAGNGASSLTALAGGGGLGLKNPDDLYIGLLQSRPVADAIVQKFDLMTAYGAKTMTAARAQLADSVKITSEKSGLISISVADSNKDRAAGIANAYTDQLRALTRNLAVTEAGQRRLFYEEQLKLAKDALDTAEAHFQQVQQKNGLVSLDAQATAMVQSLASLHAQVAAKQVEVEALRSYSTDRNPEVQLAENELASLQAQVARLEQHGGSAAPSNLGMADVPEAGMEYLRAQHEVQYQLTLFDLLLKQYDAARLDEGKEAAIIQVVERAIPPEKKSSPQRGAILALFAVFGAFAGCMYVHLMFLKQRALLDPVNAMRFEAFKRALLTGR